MTKDQIAHAIASIAAGIQGGAAISVIKAEGSGEASRDVPLGLTAEQSKPILEATAKVLKGM